MKANFINNLLNKKYDKYLIKEVSLIREFIDEYKNYDKETLKRSYENLDLKENTNILRRKVFALGTLMIELKTGMKLYDVQLYGALVLTENKIAEMRTGEGKTITSVLPVLYKAKVGNKVHVVTVNEYLAQRDKELLSPIYEAFGLTVSLNLSGQHRFVKQSNYKANIMYSTATELGFDYLNDNMVINLTDKAQVGTYDYVLIDEVDLVLIDEARTPLIIGRDSDNNMVAVHKAQTFVSKLNPEDYVVNKQYRTVLLTDKGEEKYLEFYKENSFVETQIENNHLVYQSLVANFIFEEDVDYLVNENKEVEIIDTFTGRVSHGRRYSNGLHQAIEAKHTKDGVEIKRENITVATITLQNFFRKYKEISGMSGTAHEEEKELFEVYGVSVVRVPTNKPLIREDLPIEVFNTKKEKWQHIVNRIKHYHSMNNPVLVGTTSVDDSELVSNMLKKENLPHTVLNAKQDKNEAEIIAQAGKLNAITVATNMAGRGTDIIVDPTTALVVILTELNDSSRIDNQLKGRTSRQGAPGITETIISLDDTLFVKTDIQDKLKKIYKINDMDLSKSFIKLLYTTQKELESMSFISRKSAVEYDEVIKKQRDYFYDLRDRLMNKDTTLLAFKEIATPKSLEEINHFDNEDERNRIMKNLALYCLDKQWIRHIDNLTSLKSAINWRSQSGELPIIVYQRESMDMFMDFLQEVRTQLDDELSKVRAYTSEERNAYDRKVV